MKENPFGPETLDQSVRAFVASAIECTEEVRIAEESPRLLYRTRLDNTHSTYANRK